jgi:glutathione synthase/RimK-type ligase-like ATP-grasp enzyme
MSRIRFLSYRPGSSSCRLLSSELSIPRVFLDPDRSHFKVKETDIIINWGYSGPIPKHLANCKNWVNNPVNVGLASDKLKCFKTLKNAEVPVPQFTTSRYEAELWLNGESLDDDEEGRACDIVCRSLLNSHSGKGISIVEKPVDEDFDFKTIEELCPLYVKYIPKMYEYRVHVLPGEEDTIIVRQKLRDRDIENDDINWKIRSHNNGFIFAQNLTYKPDGIENLAAKAVSSLGLSFGAVDIVYNQKYNKMYVLEVNTAPGLEGSTIDWYVESFNKYLKR